MSLYISDGKGLRFRIWNPGDPGQPNGADSKQELLSACIRPDPYPCRMPECKRPGRVNPRRSNYNENHWGWNRDRTCNTCQNLHSCHGLYLTELVTIWEEQEHRCFRCCKILSDPRDPVRQEKLNIDHDHTICPKMYHSCKRCRRGLACMRCNSYSLAIMTPEGFRMLPQNSDTLQEWLEFIGPDERERLYGALSELRRIS